MSDQDAHRRRLIAQYQAQGKPVPPQLLKSVAQARPAPPPPVVPRCERCKRFDHEDCRRGTSRSPQDCRCWICWGAGMAEQAEELYLSAAPGRVREALADLVAVLDLLADANPR